MKMLLFFHLIILLLIYSCENSNTKDEVSTFIPGTYIRSAVHEFGNEYDTLSITLQNEQVREYRIIRRWKYERILDGQPIEPEYKRQVTSAVYNSSRKVLLETETGDQYSFDPKEQTLFIGSTKYKKL